jgi:hypothetical protein
MVYDSEANSFSLFYLFETNYRVKVVEGNVEGLGVSLEESWVSLIGVF